MLVLRRVYDPMQLVTAHPPKLGHPHKRLAFELACPPGTVHRGSIELTRWAARALPPTLALAATELVVMPGYYDYAGDDAGLWHVNFADPALFFAYGSGLLAQDELQAVEHPVLGSLREALLAEGQPALTEAAGEPTPVLVLGVERRCAVATQPDRDAGRPDGLYGNRFAAASADVVRRAIHVLAPPGRTNLIAIAAPGGGHGRYEQAELRQILLTAYTGFAAALSESHRVWPSTPVEIRTGFWGCGAFGGNRHVMTVLQLLAAQLAGIDRVRFYAFDDAGQADARAGARALETVLAAGSRGEPIDETLRRIAALRYAWGTSNGT